MSFCSVHSDLDLKMLVYISSLYKGIVFHCLYTMFMFYVYVLYGCRESKKCSKIANMVFLMMVMD